MKFYCGIDLHAKDCVLCVIDNKEKIHLREKVPNRLEAIVGMLRGFSQKPAVAVEASLNWYWLVDGLEEAGFRVKLANTYGLHMITGAKVKTDPRDAFSLANKNAIRDRFFDRHKRNSNCRQAKSALT